MAKTINMECPICKKKVLFVGVHDDEGNYHGLVGCEYENDPWSGLSYALHHEGWGDCLLCTDGAYSTMGGMLFDTAEDAISALSPPNEPLTLEEVAEILAEQFGDECACNVNGNDEWLPMMCHYGDVCPDPPEHLGCWMELLRNKYRRPPEGEA